MVVKVAGYWDIWFQHKENEYDVSWRFMLKHFGISEVILMPNLNTVKKLPLDYTDVPLVEENDIHLVLDKNSDLTPILVDERGGKPLKDFVHPKKALYIFGRTGFNPLDILNWKDNCVFIEGVKEHQGVGLLHPNQACSIVLYDRMMKSWQ